MGGNCSAFVSGLVWRIQLQAGKILVGGLKSSILPVCKSNITPFFHSPCSPSTSFHSTFIQTTSSHHLSSRAAVRSRSHSTLLYSLLWIRTSMKLSCSTAVLGTLDSTRRVCVSSSASARAYSVLSSTLDPTLWPRARQYLMYLMNKSKMLNTMRHCQTFQIKYKCVR